MEGYIQKSCDSVWPLKRERGTCSFPSVSQKKHCSNPEGLVWKGLLQNAIADPHIDARPAWPDNTTAVGQEVCFQVSGKTRPLQGPRNSSKRDRATSPFHEPPVKKQCSHPVELVWKRVHQKRSAVPSNGARPACPGESNPVAPKKVLFSVADIEALKKEVCALNAAALRKEFQMLVDKTVKADFDVLFENSQKQDVDAMLYIS